MSSSPDIIKDASDALRPISDRGITVMQGWYDKDIHDRHVTLRERVVIVEQSLKSYHKRLNGEQHSDR